MANSKKPKVNVGGTIGAISGVAAAVATIVNDVVPLVQKQGNSSEQSENYILMPNLCDKQMPLTISEATQLLESYGLKILPIEVRMRDAGVKYKDCFEFQVVSSDHKPKSKLRPGEMVKVQYVTQEIINESQRLYDEAEQRKADAKQERAAKRAEQMDKAKTAMTDAASKARTGVGNIIHRNSSKKDTNTETIEE